MENYIELNKETWDKKTGVHVTSSFYDVDSFKKGRNSLTEIEMLLLGDVSGKDILHLQCHFGQDTLSLARLGAEVTGVDLSEVAIEKARELAQEMNLKGDFVCCDVYDTPQFVTKKFDVVYTSFGTIGWLPDMKRWAETIHTMLKPGGRLVFVEFHPVIWMYNNDFTEVAYDYFNSEAIVETISGSYTDRDAPIETKSVSWNHSLGEVIGALMATGLRMETFDEYPYSPFNCFNNMIEIGPRKYVLANFKKQIPMVYSLTMVKS